MFCTTFPVSLYELSPLSTWRCFSREQVKSECDWRVMTSVFVVSQSSCFFLCLCEQIRLLANVFLNDLLNISEATTDQSIEYYKQRDCSRLTKSSIRYIVNPILTFNGPFCPTEGIILLSYRLRLNKKFTKSTSAPLTAINIFLLIIRKVQIFPPIFPVKY